MDGGRAGVIVVGAGLAGLACAGELAAAGIPVRVRERGHVPGGRMASRRFDGRPADLGAAYFTVRDPDFAELVSRWKRAGLAREWTDTFVVYDADGRHVTSGPMRWSAPHGLRSLVTDLAAELPVAADRLVTIIEPGPRVDAEPVEAAVLAMPGPQAAWLLDPALGAALAAAQVQRWAPSLSVVLRYAERCWDDFAGAFVNDHPVLSAIWDDGDRRGDRAPVLVAHTTAEFAQDHLPQPTTAGPAGEAAVRELLGLPRRADHVFVHRWTYARPERTTTGDRPYYLDDDGIGLAGDAFGKPQVQTAWCSGRALGKALVARLG